jgi:hypothetical protein
MALDFPERFEYAVNVGEQQPYGIDLIGKMAGN